MTLHGWRSRTWLGTLRRGWTCIGTARLLKTLDACMRVTLALVESTESSNRLEGVVVTGPKAEFEEVLWVRPEPLIDPSKSHRRHIDDALALDPSVFA